MEAVNNLTPENISELRASIGDLESAVLGVYKNRTPRNLMGAEGILVRTLGRDYNGPFQRECKYFDSRRASEVDTEFSEVIEALEMYDKIPSEENEVELLLEVGDVLFQRKVVELKHESDENYDNVMQKFDSALDYMKGELILRDLSFEKVEQFARIKYGSRAWLNLNGYNPKDKKLERELCLDLK